MPLTGKTIQASFSSRVSFFVHPLPLAAVTVMAANDHWLKYAFPSWITGKVSDFAGVFFFPLLFAAIWISLTGSCLTQRKLLAGIGVTALVMILLKTVEPFAQLVETVFLQAGVATRITVDPTDLMALAMLPLAYRYGRKFITAYHSK